MSALSIQHLRKRYGDLVAVDDLCLEVARGQVFGLLGPNGSGKTTSLACALGLLRPTSGSIHVLGVPASALHRTRGRVGVVFDRPVLLRGHSVRANLEYAARLRGHGGGTTIEEALERVGMSRYLRHPAGRLSLGQTRRVSIAMALCGRPELLVLDEPLSGLDPIGVQEVLQLVRELARQDLTLVISSHRLFEMERVLTHAAVLIGGHLAAHGSLEELLGAKDRVRLRVEDGARAEQVLAAQPGVEVLRRREGELLVAAGDLRSFEVNRILVQAGVAVHAVDEARSSLPRLFEELVDRRKEPA